MRRQAGFWSVKRYLLWPASTLPIALPCMGAWVPVRKMGKACRSVFPTVI